MLKHLPYLFLSCGILLGCQEKNQCPDNIPASPDPAESGMSWGGNTTKVGGAIHRVVAECIRVIPPELTQENAKVKIQSVYNIPATAFIRYKIIDDAWFKDATSYKDLEATVIFEAISTSGVVLGSSEGTIKIITGGDSTKASGTISNLDIEALKKVDHINARWKYGRD